MKRFFGIEFAMIVALSSVLVVGCGDRQTTDPPADDQPATDEAAAVDEAQAEIEEALVGLSEEARQVVLAQAICPVSKQALGSMGEPIKVEVDGKDIYVCCAGCENPLLDDPEKHLANLAAQ